MSNIESNWERQPKRIATSTPSLDRRSPVLADYPLATIGAFPLPTTGALPLPTYGAGGGGGGGPRSAAKAPPPFTTVSPSGVFAI
jgi:hypothetical protein